MSLIPPFTASHLANDGMNRDVGVCESSGVNYMTGGFGNLLEFGVFYQNSNSFYNPGSSYVPIETYPSLYPTSMASAPPYQSPNTLYNSAGDENGQGIGRSAGAQLNVGWSEPSLGFLDSDTSSFVSISPLWSSDSGLSLDRDRLEDSFAFENDSLNRQIFASGDSQCNRYDGSGPDRAISPVSASYLRTSTTIASFSGSVFDCASAPSFNFDSISVSGSQVPRIQPHDENSTQYTIFEPAPGTSHPNGLINSVNAPPESGVVNLPPVQFSESQSTVSPLNVSTQGIETEQQGRRDPLLQAAFTEASPYPDQELLSCLKRVLSSAFLHSQEREPTIDSFEGRLIRGLSVSTRRVPSQSTTKESVYLIFVDRRSHTCMICGKKKGTNMRAVSCIRYHLNHRPFHCSGCQRCTLGRARFCSKSALSDHFKGQVKKQICILCQKEFRRGGMKRHWNSKHKDNEFPDDIYPKYGKGNSN